MKLLDCGLWLAGGLIGSGILGRILVDTLAIAETLTR